MKSQEHVKSQKEVKQEQTRKKYLKLWLKYFQLYEKLNSYFHETQYQADEIQRESHLGMSLSKC